MKLIRMARISTGFSLLVLTYVGLVAGGEIKIDPEGYIAYCPCMGRFGNQADHLLGSLAFAKALNRTLILPPWVEYRSGDVRSIQVPFNKYFQVEPLQDYHRVILMEDFMGETAKTIWPLHKRISFCYMERKSLNAKDTKKDCNAKEGNPFGPFWDTFRINFIASEFFGPLHYDVHHSNIAINWKDKYPAKDWPVLAFTGAPGSFPLQIENRQLQKYIQWNGKYMKKARKYIKQMMPTGAFIGIHLRNGLDWVRACEHVKSSKNLFSSPQCLGYKNERGNLYQELCMPPHDIVVAQLKKTIKEVNAEHPANKIRYVFVSSDNNHLIEELNNELEHLEISAHMLPSSDPHLDLAVLGSANYFVANCISSFSSFVVRERESKGLPSYFWAFPRDKYLVFDSEESKHDEL